MKIVMVDNFGKEYIPDTLIAKSVPEMYAKEIANFLNEKHSGDTSSIYFRMVPDNYKLHKFIP